MQHYIDQAVEQFRQLLNEQVARADVMEKGAGAKDYSQSEKIIIGMIDGDGIGPMIVREARRLLESLLEKRKVCVPKRI